VVHGQPGQILTYSISTIIRAKWTGGVVQLVECFLCKYDVLTSNPNLTKKDKIFLKRQLNYSVERKDL
jgi:hypothetical protein